MTKPRVVLADDHALLLDALSGLLADECEIVGVVKDGRALLEAVAHLKPEIAVVDLSMPLIDGLDATRQITQTMPETRVIILTMHEDPDFAAQAFRVGAIGYLSKRSAFPELLSAIREVAANRSYVTPLIAEELLGHLMPGSGASETKPQLTSQERQIAGLLADGRTKKK